MLEDLSAPVDRVVAAAAVEQRALGHPRIGTEHLLLGLLDDPGCAAAELLTASGVSRLAARHMVAEVVVTEPGSDPPQGMDFTPRARRALDRAGRFARRERAPDVTDLHLLLGVLDVEGLACQVLRRLGVDLPRLRRASGDVAPDLAESEHHDSDVAANDAAAPDAAGSVDAVARPTCPRCGAALDGALRVTTVATVDVDGRPLELPLAHCAQCGATIGVLPPRRDE